jgi:hypothetical protein
MADTDETVAVVMATAKLAATAHRSEFELIFTYLRDPCPRTQSSPDGDTVADPDLGWS